MAVTKGCLGIIKVKDAAATGAAARMYRVRDWTIAETADRLESTEMGACAKTYVAGSTETSISINAWYDMTATANQDDMTVGNDVYVEIYPAGTGSLYYKTPTAGANLQEVNRSASVDGIVEVSFSMTVNGAMTSTGTP